VAALITVWLSWTLFLQDYETSTSYTLLADFMAAKKQRENRVTKNTKIKNHECGTDCLSTPSTKTSIMMCGSKTLPQKLEHQFLAIALKT
jgi:hypothetical protein